MQTITLELLAQLRNRTGTSSNQELARLLRVSSRTISSYEARRIRMSEKVALRAAKVLGRSPGLIFVTLAAERTTNPQLARIWRRFARELPA